MDDFQKRSMSIVLILVIVRVEVKDDIVLNVRSSFCLK